MSRRAALAAIVVLMAPRATDAHPVPFSYLDLRVHPDRIEGSLVVHVLDVAHDLAIDPPERVLDPKDADSWRERIGALLAPRLTVLAGGRPLGIAWTGLEALTERDSVRLALRMPLDSPAGAIAVRCALFPYDPNHQTFLNVYEGDRLVHQAILDLTRARFDFYPGTREGRLAVIARFVPEGVRHILAGPDHVVFLVGILLLGATRRRVLVIVTAFTLAHSVTLTLAALGIVSPPARVIDPAIALSIVYVGADNLLVKGGRDMRPWIALSFGAIHGLGFAAALRALDLTPRALGWSLVAFNAGVEIGQVLVVVLLAPVIALLRERSAVLGRRIAVAGSVLVMCAGAFWFIQRVFFVAS